MSLLKIIPILYHLYAITGSMYLASEYQSDFILKWNFAFSILHTWLFFCLALIMKIPTMSWNFIVNSRWVFMMNTLKLICKDIHLFFEVLRLKAHIILQNIKKYFLLILKNNRNDLTNIEETSNTEKTADEPIPLPRGIVLLFIEKWIEYWLKRSKIYSILSSFYSLVFY